MPLPTKFCGEPENHWNSARWPDRSTRNTAGPLRFGGMRRISPTDCSIPRARGSAVDRPFFLPSSPRLRAAFPAAARICLGSRPPPVRPLSARSPGPACAALVCAHSSLLPRFTWAGCDPVAGSVPAGLPTCPPLPDAPGRDCAAHQGRSGGHKADLWGRPRRVRRFAAE
jgi:hypothetical protein